MARHLGAASTPGKGTVWVLYAQDKAVAVNQAGRPGEKTPEQPNSFLLPLSDRQLVSSGRAIKLQHDV